ncbi:MAG TPA: hypothetical protein VJ728_13390 [Candidatus Binataceae bacterium]|nr:hypothetical protein [Candidatus Binataceae bacterium]
MSIEIAKNRVTDNVTGIRNPLPGEGPTVRIIYSGGGQFYAVPDVERECGLWLSVETHSLPVPPEWRRPDSVCACVIRGRDYYRIGMFRPVHTDGSEVVSADDSKVTDYRDAAWWTPGLEKAWAAAQRVDEAMETARRGVKQHNQLHVWEKDVAPSQQNRPATLSSKGVGAKQSRSGRKKD